MNEKPKILCVGEPPDGESHLLDNLDDRFDIVRVKSRLRAFAQLAREQFSAIYVFPARDSDGLAIAKWTQSERILESLPEGVALLDEEDTIIWANDRLKKWSGKSTIVETSFFEAFASPEILGTNFSAFQAAISTGKATSTLLRSAQDDDDTYYRVHASPVHEANGPTQFCIVSVRNVTDEILQQRKLTAIHKAGLELSELAPEDVYEMEIDERIELLKQNIIHYTTDLLEFDVIEIRLMDQQSGELAPLLAVGMSEDAMKRTLFASPTDNGVTGFVASTGKSYMCEDTVRDPLYLQGSEGAKSSLTVPLIQHDQVIGTVNVESPAPGAFSESDLQFVEIFSRDIAVALNTLELLVAQQANTAQASCEAIHGEVALPVDEILNDAVNVMERYIGHEPEVVERLQRILRNARDIKQVIHRVGEKMAPSEAVIESPERSAWPRLKKSRILVVDNDESVRTAAHALLERFSCIVETAHEANEAILMVRTAGTDDAYDAIIADIRLPDLSGYQLLLKLKEHLAQVPMILMSGFGYDPGHSIVKARQAGLLPNAVLYKPFRLDQLLTTVDAVIEATEKVSSS